jgi:predicted nucleic acid-binding protein
MGSETNTRVFLDTNVVAALLRGDPRAQRLLAPEALARVQYCISPTVAMELVHVGSIKSDEDFARLSPQFAVLPESDLETVKRIGDRVRQFRNNLAHATDMINIATAEAADCQFFVTEDKNVASLEEAGGVRVLSVEAFVHEVLS